MNCSIDTLVLESMLLLWMLVASVNEWSTSADDEISTALQEHRCVWGWCSAQSTFVSGMDVSTFFVFAVYLDGPLKKNNN